MKKITATEAFSRAWKIFKDNPIQHIGVFLLAFIIIGIFNSLGDSKMSSTFMQHDLNGSDMSAMLHVSPLWSIVNFIVQSIVYLFILGYTLDVVRKNYQGLSQVFSKYVTLKLFLYYFIFSILISLLTIILLLPGLLMLFSNSGGSASLLLLIGFLILFYILLRLIFTSYLFLDGYDFADALKISWQKTKPYIGELLLLIILAVLFIFLGLIALLIGVTVAIPVVYFAQAVFYNEAVSEPADQTPATEALEQ